MRVLISSPSEDVRGVVGSELESYGIRPIIVSDLRSLREMLSVVKFDLVIADVAVDPSVATVVRRLQPRSKIWMIVEDILAADNRNVDFSFLAPVVPELLRLRIADLMREKPVKQRRRA